MAIVIGLHGNVCCPNNTGRVTFVSNLSCCLVKFFVHTTHWRIGHFFCGCLTCMILDNNLKVLAMITYFKCHFFHTSWHFYCLETPPMLTHQSSPAEMTYSVQESQTFLPTHVAQNTSTHKMVWEKSWWPLFRNHDFSSIGSYQHQQILFFFFFFFFLFDVFIYLYLGLVGGDKTYKIEPPDPITLSK